MDSYTTVNGLVHQQSQVTTDSSMNAAAPPPPRQNVVTATRVTSRVATPYLDRISNRNSTPFPDFVETEDSPSSLSFNLADSASNASLQLQRQLNLMAQAIAIQSAPSASSTFPLLSHQPTTNSASLLRGASNSEFSNMLDQYISAAAVTAFHRQQQLQLANLVVAPNNQQFPAVSSTPATVANFSVPLAAYLQSPPPSQASSMGAAIQLLQQAQDSSSTLGPTHSQTNPTVLNSLLSTLCHCDVLAVNPNANTCPLHGSQNNDGNNNLRRPAANVPLLSAGEMPVQIGNQRQQAPILVSLPQPNDQMVQQQQQSNGIIQHQSSTAAVGLAAAIQTHRMARSSLKRSSNGATSTNVQSVVGPTEEEGGILSGTANSAVHVSSPPPLLVSPNATSVRLSSGLGVPQGGDGGGPSRGPKLRRLASFGEMTASDGEIASQTHLNGQVATTDLAEFRSPSVASASSAATNVAAALVQLQQQAAVAAAIPSTVTFLSSLANGSPSSTATANSQQSQLSAGDASLSSMPSVVQPVVDSTAVSLAADLGSAVSLSTGVEQLVAAAISTATFPQTIAAMAASSAFPPQNAAAVPPYAVCAATAACHQSRMGPSMAATVTACSCLHHHHHHHLHCHHNTVVPSPPFPAVYTLCNHVAGGDSPSPSSNTTIAQPHQNQQSSNSLQTNNMNNGCINTTGTPIVANPNGNNRIVANGGVSSLQSTAQIGPIAQRYLAMNSSAFMSNGNNGGGMERIPLTNNISANVNIHATSGGSAAVVAAAALSPSNVTAMLLNSAAAMGQQQNSLPQLVQAAPYSLRNFPVMGDFAVAQQPLPNVTSMQQNLLATRFVQQEREREAVNHFYQQQRQQNHVVRPLIMVPRLPSQLDLANVLLLHNPGSVDDAATLVLNGGSSVTSALAHATNPHHIVANAMATATAPEPQPVGVSLEQIKKHSQKLSYVKDPDVPEQERDRCTVCLSDFETGDELRALNCTHLFHTECIDRWLQYNKKCPVCRVDMDKGGAGSSAMTTEATLLNAYAAAAAASTASNTTAC